MQIGKTYTRTAPDGNVSTWEIEKQDQLEYHRGLTDQGYTYKEKLNIATSDNVCVACEG